MNRFFDLIKKILPLILFLLLLAEVVYVVSQAINLPFSFIDDTELAFRHKEVISGFNIGGLLGGLRKFFTAYPGVKDGGLAVSYWLIVELRYLLVGFNASAQYWMHLGVMISSLLLVGSIIKKITKDNISSLLSMLVLMVSFSGYENWFRLNTQEPVQTLGLLVLIYIILKIKKFDWRVILTLLFFLFSKENSFLYWPIFGFWFLIEKNKKIKETLKKTTVLMFGLNFVLVVVLFLLSLGNWTGSKTSLTNIPQSALGYWSQFKSVYLIQLLIAILISKLVSLRKVKNSRYFVLFLFSGLVAIGTMLPWEWPLLRYTLTSMSMFALTIGIYSANIINHKLASKNRIKNLLNVLFISIVMIVGVKYWYVNLVERVKIVEFFGARETSNFRFASWISSLPENTYLVFDVPSDDGGNVYWVTQLNKYLEVYFNRADINIQLKDNFEKDPNENDYLVSWSQVSNSKIQKSDPVKMFEEDYYEIKTSMTNFAKNIFLRKPMADNLNRKSISWSIYRL